jgi:DNA repair protein RecO (recombination protein O)
VSSIQTEGLILRTVDFGESDRILHLLVPDSGRLTAIAKGARRSKKRFAGTLDLFNHVRIQVDQRRPNAMARLDQARLVSCFPELRSHPVRYGLGCYLLELFDRLAPESGVRADTGRLFEFALRALATLATQTPDARLRTLLELRALDALGLRPELRRCVRCGGAPEHDGVIDFHVAEGGPVCGACGGHLEGLLRLQLGTARSLEQGLRFDFEHLERLSLSPRALAEARQLLGRFQRFHLGVALRSEAFLAEVLPDAGS